MSSHFAHKSVPNDIIQNNCKCTKHIYVILSTQCILKFLTGGQ